MQDFRNLTVWQLESTGRSQARTPKSVREVRRMLSGLAKQLDAVNRRPRARNAENSRTQADGES
jgi:hypothetical protein